MTTKNKTFQHHLEEAIIECRKMACPDFSCSKMLTSKEIILSDHHSVLEYACQNPSCQYHHPKKIDLYYDNTIKQSAFSETKSNVNYLHIAIGVFVFLLGMLFSSFVWV